MTRKYNSKRLVWGVGTKGDGAISVNGKPTKAYDTWQNMLRRCYSSRSHKLRPTYINCTVCNEWLYFPTFKQWFDANYVEGYQLDKDLLVDGNKEYGPTTCIFVPQQINTLFNDNGRSRGGCPIGVSFEKRVNKFRASLSVDGTLKFLGHFGTEDEAHRTYLIAKKANVIRMANEWKDKISDKLYIALIQKAEEM